MRVSTICRALFWHYRDGKIDLKELNREMDKLEDKQERLNFKGGQSNGKEDHE